jgi:hypothetical protein
MTGIWQRAYEAGLADYGALPIRPEVFEFRARDLLARRLSRQGRGAGELSLAALFARTAGPDLVLATAVEHGSPEARQVLETRFLPRLAALLQARDVHAPPEEVEATVRSALAEWSAPVGHGAVATRIGTFDATGSLHAWLSVLLLLRRAVPGPATRTLAAENSTELPGTAATALCPDANLLAGFLEGRLEARERTGVDAHLNACSVCLELVGRLRAAGIKPVAGLPPEEALVAKPRGTDLVLPMPGPSRLPPPRGGGSWKTWTAIVLILGGILSASMMAGGRTLWDTDARKQDTEHDVFRAASVLVERQPGYFGDFAPYDREELESKEAPADFQGFVAAHPRGAVFERTPRFVWSGAPGAARYRVTLRDLEGQEAWSRTATGTALDWPADVEQLRRETSWVWDVRPEGSATPPAKAKFHVTTEQEALRWGRHKDRIAKEVSDPGARAVLTAQVALRRGHAWEAFTVVREHLDRYPKDAYGRALYDYLARVHALHP